MPRKRRKLNPELERKISEYKRKVELVTAIINDIEEEDIQKEYRAAFEPVKNSYILLDHLYKIEGQTEASLAASESYAKFLTDFEGEYEI